MRIDTRVKLIEADFGGDDCSGEAFVQEYCHAGDCPSGKSLHTLYTSSGTEKIVCIIFNATNIFCIIQTL